MKFGHFDDERKEYVIETAAAAVAVAAGPAAGAADAAEEKSSFDVVLAEVGGAKLQVVKVQVQSPAWCNGLKDLVVAQIQPLAQKLPYAKLRMCPKKTKKKKKRPT